MKNVRLCAITLLIIIVTLILLSVSGCKSLEKRCIAKFPASINHNYSLIIRDTTIPEYKISGNGGPCPDWFKQLPEDGKQTIVAEDEKAQIRASRGKNGNIALEALFKAQNLKGANKSESSRTDQVMHLPCDCSDQIKAAKWNLIVDILFVSSIIVILGIGGYYYWKHYKKGKPYA